MARIAPIAERDLGLATRFWFWLSRRLFGRVLAPLRIMAHAPRLVAGSTLMSGFFGSGRWAIDPQLRTLIHLRVASIIGCVF